MAVAVAMMEIGRGDWNSRGCCACGGSVSDNCRGRKVIEVVMILVILVMILVIDQIHNFLRR